MTNKYLGETIVNVEDSPYKGFTKEQWILKYIESYGQIDGSHHKQWILDQIARIIHNTPITIKLAKWSKGTKEYYIYGTDAPSKEYLDWVEEMKEYDAENDEYVYGYDEGIAP